MNPAESNPSQPPPLTPSERPKINWIIFFIVLLAPALLTLCAAKAGVEGAAVGCPLIGGGIAGIVCGIMLGRRLGRTQGAKVGLGILFTAVFGFLSFALGFVGCMVGGFQMNFR